MLRPCRPAVTRLYDKETERVGERENVMSNRANPEFCRDGGVLNITASVHVYLRLELRSAYILSCWSDDLCAE
jgi:hypothetical protein